MNGLKILDSKNEVMNEHMDYLLYRSGLTAQGCWDELDDYAKQAIYQFANLIVNECAMIASEHVESIEGVTFGVGRAVKNHFGVGEIKRETFETAFRKKFDGGLDLSGRETP